MARAYDMTQRELAAAQTADRIVVSAEDLLTRLPIEQVTLQAVAETAGVTVQTVLRHMKSREGCFAAVATRVQQRVAQQRESLPSGDPAQALHALVNHYETDGRLILNLLSQESASDFAADAASRGRAYHRDWVRRLLLPQGNRALRDQITEDALVACTDLYVWKLLRLDLQRSRQDTEAAMTRLVIATLQAQNQKN
jgi:AcrR family transcriptional regulator